MKMVLKILLALLGFAAVVGVVTSLAFVVWGPEDNPIRKKYLDIRGDE